MCYAWDGKVDYEGYLKLAGDVFIKLGHWVHRAYKEELVVLELCSQVSELMNDIQEELFWGFYDRRVLKLVVPVLKRFVEGDDYDLTNLMRFVDDLRGVFMRLQPLSRQINREKAEEILSSSGAPEGGELPS